MHSYYKTFFRIFLPIMQFLFAIFILSCASSSPVRKTEGNFCRNFAKRYTIASPANEKIETFYCDYVVQTNKFHCEITNNLVKTGQKQVRIEEFANLNDFITEAGKMGYTLALSKKTDFSNMGLDSDTIIETFQYDSLRRLTRTNSGYPGKPGAELLNKSWDDKGRPTTALRTLRQGSCNETVQSIVKSYNDTKRTIQIVQEEGKGPCRSLASTETLEYNGDNELIKRTIKYKKRPGTVIEHKKIIESARICL